MVCPRPVALRYENVYGYEAVEDVGSNGGFVNVDETSYIDRTAWNRKC